MNEETKTVVSNLRRDLDLARQENMKLKAEATRSKDVQRLRKLNQQVDNLEQELGASRRLEAAPNSTERTHLLRIRELENRNQELERRNDTLSNVEQRNQVLLRCNRELEEKLAAAEKRYEESLVCLEERHNREVKDLRASHALDTERQLELRRKEVAQARDEVNQHDDFRAKLAECKALDLLDRVACLEIGSKGSKLTLNPPVIKPEDLPTPPAWGPGPPKPHFKG